MSQILEGHIRSAKKMGCMKALTPEIRFDIFDTTIRPIIMYGSDVLGFSKTGYKVVINYFWIISVVYSVSKPQQAILLCLVNVANFLQYLLSLKYTLLFPPIINDASREHG